MTGFAQDVAHRLVENIERVIFGKRDAVELAVIGLLAQGHLLIEDVPGVGKTMLAKAMARSIGGTFRRIQFTPDMLPSDITGVSIFNPGTRAFEFRPGPIMANIVLADEINRATPKTQAALLEAMEERQVSVDGVTHTLPQPFLVLATQNPIEYEGTFPLPEAELDRFMLRIRLGYPSRKDELAILEAQQFRHPIETLEQVVQLEELRRAQEEIRGVHVSAEVKGYLLEIVERTREHPDIYLGASPRGALALFRTAQARAVLRGRDYVLPDDVKALVQPCLAHRLILNPEARMRDITPEQILIELMNRIPVPGAALA
ncbi:AAA family ATPase [Thermoflexus sp.]|uniref:AAA family ATPase n=1 Tax=Thermoflexus sp. TaxID=1969742 RepID=UPI0025D53B0A|nr:MoxR family ATPase [Thermoflexus sp.]MCS6964213.1 MoxR family ATPase [Thermoflexus sp.]MCS7350491.1 MoxR family ATPase [Thermoflexus sp.]MDW8179942.1 MoxR family ATPase [Anaerolineae bacterium]MDW8184438.1 MoxR family ATPase [Anaerolineae bacterium]